MLTRTGHRPGRDPARAGDAWITRARGKDQDLLDMPVPSALDEIGFAACTVDCQLRYRRVNAAWQAYLRGDTFGHGPGPVSIDGRRIVDDISVSGRERWSEALAAIVAGRLGHFLDRAVERRTLGDRLVVTTASPTFDADGRVDGALCIRYDVTDAGLAATNQERIELALLASRRLQHFLGNQLALTLGYVELLTFDPRLPGELRDRVDEALRGVIGATQTLSLLRQLTRLEIPADDPEIVKLLGPPGAN
jgi:hypothetical protein